jgi:histidine triad (HIT) family protein
MNELSIFEKIILRQIPANIVHEDELCIAFHDVAPQAPIHLLIVPKQRINRIGEAQPAHQSTLGHLFLIAAKIANDLGILSTDKGFRIVINHGKDAGETVPHLHIHLLAGRSLNWPPG